MQLLLDQVFTAEDLMTPVKDVERAEPGNLDAARTKAIEERYDVLPVFKNEHIIGIFRVDTAEPEPLTDRWLISRDTPILDLINLFVETEQPAFLILHRQEVIGLVTPADLNKLPARVYVYNLIGELELKLAALVQTHFRSDQARFRQALSDERWKKIASDYVRLKRGNADVDPVQLLYLKDLINIVSSEEVTKDNWLLLKD